MIPIVMFFIAAISTAVFIIKLTDAICKAITRTGVPPVYSPFWAALLASVSWTAFFALTM